MKTSISRGFSYPGPFRESRVLLFVGGSGRNRFVKILPMSKKNIISVIIPAYNRDYTIGRGIKSVLNQTFQDFEIIVVDDGSTDNTLGVVHDFSAPKVRCLRHEDNRGAAAARNTGIRAAFGDYVAFLDSDDEWLPEKLSEQMNHLRRVPDSVNASCTGLYIHQIDTQKTIERVPHTPASWFMQLLTGCDLCPGTTLVVTRASFDRVGLFDEKLSRYEDWDWLLRYVEKYPLAIVEKPLARVYKEGRPSGAPMERSATHFIAKHHHDLQWLGTYRRRQVVARLFLRVSEAYYGEGKKAKGSAFLFKALIQNPIQRVGMYLQVMDAVLGTCIAPKASQFKSGLWQRA